MRARRSVHPPLESVPTGMQGAVFVGDSAAAGAGVGAGVLPVDHAPRGSWWSRGVNVFASAVFAVP